MSYNIRLVYTVALFVVFYFSLKLFYQNNMFHVCKYFDTYTDGIVGTYETREEAQKKLDSMPIKIYTTYEIRIF